MLNKITTSILILSTASSLSMNQYCLNEIESAYDNISYVIDLKMNKVNKDHYSQSAPNNLQNLRVNIYNEFIKPTCDDTHCYKFSTQFSNSIVYNINTVFTNESSYENEMERIETIYNNFITNNVLSKYTPENFNCSNFVNERNTEIGSDMFKPILFCKNYGSSDAAYPQSRLAFSALNDLLVSSEEYKQCTGIDNDKLVGQCIACVDTHKNSGISFGSTEYSYVGDTNDGYEIGCKKYTGGNYHNQVYFGYSKVNSGVSKEYKQCNNIDNEKLVSQCIACVDTHKNSGISFGSTEYSYVGDTNDGYEIDVKNILEEITIIKYILDIRR